MASAQGRGRRASPRNTHPCRRAVRQGAARRKFLRSPRAEYAACLDAVKRLAMARSDVGFTLEHDGRRVLTLQPGDAPSRVAELLSHELDRHGVGIDCARDGLRLTGVISLPTFNRGMADQQYLFVNSRPVKDRLLVGAFRAAYRDLIARDRHPIAALFLDVPLDEVDVNVHPAKTEVRFRDPAAVRGLIIGGLRHALDEESQRSAAREQAAAPVMWTTSASYRPRARASRPWARRAPCASSNACSKPVSFAPAPAPNPRSSRSRPFRSALRGARSPQPISLPKPRTGSSSSTSTRHTNGWCWNGCGRRARAGIVARQALLIPEVVELDEPDCDRLEGAADELAAWVLNSSGSVPRTMLVRAVPAALGKTDAVALLADLAAEIAELGGPLEPSRQARPCRRDHRLPRLGSCRSHPFGRRDECAPAGDGSDAAFRPVQSRSPDVGEARPRRDRKTVRPEEEVRRSPTVDALPHSLRLPHRVSGRHRRRASARRERRRGKAVRPRLSPTAP